MTVLVTGVAGFIGYHCARTLLERGEAVLGVDDLNPYYSVALKRERLKELEPFAGFRFRQVDIADREALAEATAGAGIRAVIHLAAQPGVRYSLENPQAYMMPNVVGHLNMLEFCRGTDGIEHMVYASSSSVYGANTKVPFSEADRVDNPISLYAATKRADELMSHCYAHLYRIPLTGLRFFTVYGPWGRPDMAVWLFTEAILAGRPIQVFDHRGLRRDFTFIDDIVGGVVSVLGSPPGDGGGEAPHRIYNIGNNRAEDLDRLIALIEEATGRRAERQLLPLPPGDVTETFADIDAIKADHGFAPATPIDVGIPIFVDWYRARYGGGRVAAEADEVGAS